MPIIKFQTVVPGSLERVYEYVTAFSTSGRTNHRALEEKHGKLVSRDGDSYIFQDDADDQLTWVCTFEPPHNRTMRAPESKWADRIDLFETSGEGTLWSVVWESKTTGIRSYTQWLSFHLRGKRQAYQSVILPVLRHFQEGGGAPRRAPRRRPRRRRQQ